MPDHDIRIDQRPSKKAAWAIAAQWTAVLRSMELQQWWGVYAARYRITNARAKVGDRARYAYGVYLSLQDGVSHDDAIAQAELRGLNRLVLRMGTRA